MVSRRCVVCLEQGITSRRKAPYPGPLCSSHNKAQKIARNDLKKGRRLVQVYNMTIEQYWKIYEFQKARNEKEGLTGACAICGYATGRRKRRLSVDHCHETGRVRGLLCQPCNRWVLGHLRDSPEALQRAIDYLANPPAIEAVGTIYVPEDIDAAEMEL